MTKKRIYCFLFVLVLCFIWVNSMLSKEVSQTISRFVAGALGGGAGSGDEGHHIVRKLAHFIEFVALGVTAHLFLEAAIRDKHKRHLTLALIGVATPIVDETIQIFSGRGPSLSDVWIDFAGYATGALAVFAVLFALSRVTKKPQLHS